MSFVIKYRVIIVARCLGMWVVMWTLTVSQVVWSGETHVAVASNFLTTLKEIAESYKRDTGNKLILIS